MKRALLAAVLLAAACSRQEQLNYRHCLKLRVGMSRDAMLKIMGPAEETEPFVEGKSLEYLRGRTAYEWSNPASMPGPDHVSVDDKSGTIASIRCANSEISASVFPDAAEPSTATAAAPAVPPPAAAKAPSAPAAPAAKAPTVADAVAAYKKKDLQACLRIAVPLSESGDADAQMVAGLAFLNADKVGLVANFGAAQRWLYTSGRAKNCEAAALYAFTIAGKLPPEKVLEERVFAASLGCPSGKYLQALNLLDADMGGDKDADEGLKTLTEAAQGGVPKAQLSLGKRRAAAKDAVEAYRWLSLAASRPVVGVFDDPLGGLSALWSDAESAEARTALAAVAKSMSPAQIAEAKKRAASK